MLRFVVVSAAASLLAAATSASADPLQEGLASFRVIFVHDKAELASGGPESDANRLALQRFTRAFTGLGRINGLRLMFVSERPACPDQSSCVPEQLVWERTQAVMNVVRQEAKGLGVPVQLSGGSFAFADEIGLRDGIPVSLGGGDALFLVASIGGAPGAACRGGVLLRSPALPPAIGNASIDGAMMASEQGEMPPVPQLEFRIAWPMAQYGVALENAEGQFRKAPEQVWQNFQPLPATVKSLRLISRGSPEHRQFLAQLSDAFANVPYPKRMAQQRDLGGLISSQDESEISDRGTGNLVKPYRGGARPGPRSEMPDDAEGKTGSDECVFRFALN
jgi:hypothetical protein